MKRPTIREPNGSRVGTPRPFRLDGFLRTVGEALNVSGGRDVDRVERRLLLARAAAGGDSLVVEALSFSCDDWWGLRGAKGGSGVGLY